MSPRRFCVTEKIRAYHATASAIEITSLRVLSLLKGSLIAKHASVDSKLELKLNTVFYVISAPSAFEIRIEKVPSIFPKTFLLILCNLQLQKERGGAY